MALAGARGVYRELVELKKDILKFASELTFLEKWIILGTVIGIAAGLFATFFYVLLELVTSTVAYLLGAPVPSFTKYADLSVALIDAFKMGTSRYILLLVPPIMLLGALVSSIIVYRYAPEAEGHGTDAAIRGFHRAAGILRVRVPIVKAVASALTIGTGGSGGVEGPSALMGAGIGSAIAQFLKMNMWDRRIALLAGMSAALSALFRAPIGASIFAVEVLYKRDIEVRALIPSIIAAIVGYAVTMPFWGYAEVFPKVSVTQSILYTGNALVAYMLLGVFMAPFAALYVKLFYGVRNLLTKLIPQGQWIRPVIGAAAAALVGILAPLVLGSGRQLLTEFLANPAIVKTFVGEGPTAYLGMILMAIAVAKIMATAFSIGSGGSGGVFAPGITAGALLGYSFGVLIGSKMTGISPLVFAYLGMSAFFAAASKAPLATSFMVTEMSGSYGLLVPALLSSYLSRELTRGLTIYESQIPHRIRPELVNVEAVLDTIRRRRKRIGIRAIDIAEKRFRSLKASEPIARAIELMVGMRQHLVPVVDDNNRLLGVIDGSLLEALLESKPSDPISMLPIRRPPLVEADEDILHVIDVLEETEADVDYVVVVDPHMKYQGVILYTDLITAIAFIYTQEFIRRTEELRKEIMGLKRKKQRMTRLHEE
ncbi:MAG: chloride channel protein [Pyrodictiaceae archaeon]